MPNWCSNFLIVEPTNKSKEAKEQLHKFVSDIKEVGETLSIGEAEKYREKFLEANFESRYRDAAEVFVHHSEMPLKDFMKQVVEYEYKEDIKKFISGETNFSMHKLLPVPMDLMHPDLESYGGNDAKKKDEFRKKMIEKHGYKSWYDWRIAHWGCKWGVDAEIDVSDTFVSYRFDSAWSPPIEFLENICERYPLLNFHLSYSEPGNNYEGDLRIEAGNVTENDQREYSGFDGDTEADDENF